MAPLRALLIVGLGLYWPLLTMSKVALNALFFPGDQLTPMALAFTAFFMIGALVISGAESARHPVRPVRLARTSLRARTLRRLIPAIGAAASACMLVGAIARPTEGIGIALSLAACLLTSAAFCLLTVLWGGVALPLIRARGTGLFFVDIAVSLMASFVVRLLTALAFGEGVPALVGVFVSVAYPLLACLPCAFLGNEPGTLHGAREPLSMEGEAGEASTAREASAATHTEDTLNSGFLAAVAACAVLVSMLMGIHSGSSTAYPIDPSGTRYWIALAVSAVVLTLAVLGRKNSRGETLAWGFVLIFALCGALLSISPMEDWAPTGLNFLAVSRLVLWSLFWTLPVRAAAASERAQAIRTTETARAAETTGTSRMTGAAAEGEDATRASQPDEKEATSRGSVTRLLCLYYLVPQGIAYLFTDSLYAFRPSFLLEGAGFNIATLALSIGLMACAFVVVSLTVARQQRTELVAAVENVLDASAADPAEGPAAGSMRGSSAAAAEQIASLAAGASASALVSSDARLSGTAGASVDPLDQACRDIAREYDLTAREAAILAHLARGYTVQRIAEEECVTANTVRTHCKGVYRKLDCHTKQEVIDLVVSRSA